MAEQIQDPTIPPVASVTNPPKEGDPEYVKKVYGAASLLLKDKYPNISEEQFQKNLHQPEFVKGLYDEIKKTGQAELPDFESFSKKITPSVSQNQRNWLEKMVADGKSITDIPSDKQLEQYGKIEYRKALREAKDNREAREAEQAQPIEGEIMGQRNDVPFGRNIPETKTVVDVLFPKQKPVDEKQKYRGELMSFAKEAIDKGIPVTDHAIRTVNSIAEFALSPTEKEEFRAIKKTEALMPYWNEALAMEKRSKGEDGKPLTPEEQIQVTAVKKQMTRQLNEYEKTVANTHQKLDEEISELVKKREKVYQGNLMESDETRKFKTEQIDKEIKQLNDRKQFFLDPTKYVSQKVKDYKLSGDMFDNMSDRQKLTGYMLSKYQESKEILEEYGYQPEFIEKMIDPRGSIDISSGSDAWQTTQNALFAGLARVLGNKNLETVQKNMEIIKDLAPVALANRNPILGMGNEGPEKIFAKSVWETAVGGNPKEVLFWTKGNSNSNLTEKERSSRLLDAFVNTGADYSNASPQIKHMLDEKSKPYESWSTESLAETLGVTTGIMLPAMAGGMAARSGLKVVSEAPKIGNVANWLLKGESVTSRVIMKGIEYETGGRLFGRNADELDTGSGVLGALGSEVVDALGRNIKIGKAIPFIKKMFAEKSEDATRKMVTGWLSTRLGAGAGETAEETFQSIYQLYRDSESAEKFKSQLKQQFGNFSDASFFVASTFAMGMAIGGSSSKSGTQMATEITAQARAEMTPEERVRQEKIELKLLGEKNNVTGALVARKLPESSNMEVDELVGNGKKALDDINKLMTNINELNPSDLQSFAWTIEGDYGTISGNGIEQLRLEKSFQENVLNMAAQEKADRSKKKAEPVKKIEQTEEAVSSEEKPSIKIKAKKTVVEEEVAKNEDMVAETKESSTEASTINNRVEKEKGPNILSLSEKEISNAPDANDRLSMAITESVNTDKKVAWLGSIDYTKLDENEKEIFDEQVAEVAEEGYELPKYTVESEISSTSEVIPDVTSNLPNGTVTRVFQNEIMQNGEVVVPGRYMVASGNKVVFENIPETTKPQKNEIEKFNALSHANRFRKQLNILASNFNKTGQTSYQGEIRRIPQKNNGSRLVAVVNGKEMQITLPQSLPENIRNLKNNESVPVTLNYVRKQEWNADDRFKRPDGSVYTDKIEVRDMDGRAISNISEGKKFGLPNESGKRIIAETNETTGSIITIENDATLAPSGKIDMTIERAFEAASKSKSKTSQDKKSIIAKLDSNRKPCK